MKKKNDPLHFSFFKDPHTIGIINLRKPDEDIIEKMFDDIYIRDFVWMTNDHLMVLNRDFKMEELNPWEDWGG